MISKDDQQPAFGDLEAARRPESPLWAIVLLGLGYAGYFKGSAWLTDLPVDLTAAFAVACAIGVAVRVIRRRRFDGLALSLVLGLWVVFGLGAVMVIDGAQSGDKLALLATVTLLCAVAPCFLLGDVSAQRLWLVSTLVMAGLMAVAAMFEPDPVLKDDFGRLNLDGTSTIGTGRVVGAGVVVAAIFALTLRSRRWTWWAVAAIGGVGLVAVGSRGPFLAVVVSIVAVVMMAKVFKGVRTPTIMRGLVAIGILSWAVASSSARSADRLLLFFVGETSDAAREYLAQAAWTIATHNPLGVGWGGFGMAPSVAAVYGGLSVYPHNLTLEIFVEGGWLAGAVFIAFTYYAMHGYVRVSSTPEAAALLGLGVYWLTVAQTSSDINGNRMTWISLALGVMCSCSVRTFRTRTPEYSESSGVGGGVTHPSRGRPIV